MSSQQSHALRADNQINSPYKRATHSGTFGGVLGDKENAGSEARAAAAAAEGKLAQEIAHHLKGAAASPACGKQQQHDPSNASGLSPTVRSVFFAAATADSGDSPAGAVIGAAGPVLPLSPSSTAAHFSNTNCDRYGFGGSGGRGGREGVTPHSRTVRGTVRSRPKKPVAGRREVHVSQALPSPTSALKTPEKVALSDAAADRPVPEEDEEATSAVPGGLPKRSRSPVADLALPPPARCDDEVSRDFEAKARRRPAARYSSTAARATSGASLCSSSGGGGSVFDSGSCDGRWRKLQARGGGGADGPPRLKLSVETAGDNDEVLLSPSGHQGDGGGPPARYYCSSPVSLSPAGLAGSRGRGEDNVLTSSVDSAWSMGSIDETAAREVNNTREEDKTSGGDPVARMLLRQSDDCSINSAAASTPEGGGRGNVDDPVSSSPGGDGGSPPPRAARVAGADVSSPHAFEVAGGGDGGSAGAAASVLRSTAKGGDGFDAGAPRRGLFSVGVGVGSRGTSGFGDASVVPRTRLFTPVTFRLP